MIRNRILTSAEQLPRLPLDTVDELFLDVETVSGDDKRGATKPYHGDQICGIAFTVDRHESIWYLPIRHRSDSGSLPFDQVINIDPKKALQFVQDLVGRERVTWINHNIKFDAHFLATEGIDIRCKMVDTMTLARVVDMQSKVSGYGLKPLAEEWCGMPPTDRDLVKEQLKGLGTKDYGRVDVKTLGKYACEDVRMNRKLWGVIQRKRYEGIDRVWDIENRLTKVLYNIEQRGLRIDVERLKKTRIATETNIARIEFEVERLGYKVDLNSTQSVVRFITQTLGLPVVAETGRGRPSASAEAIVAYQELAVDYTDDAIGKFFDLLGEHRDASQFLALYLRGWSEWVDERNIIRPMYRQTVRSGRMSCGQPNIQQLSSEAKRLIVPAPGNSFLSRDYSQIEYRVIASICRDQNVIAAYRDDPATDFHNFVARMCGIRRKPAKSINFGIAFGMGEPTLIRQLASILGSSEAESQAKQILCNYHSKFPTIRATASLAERRARSRGWIRTLYGRRRALGDGFTHKAFNSAVQGTAADIVKERAFALETDQLLKDAGVTIRAIVHDEFLFEGPTEAIEDPKTKKYIDEIMCNPSLDIGVPLLVDGGTSEISWAGVHTT